MSLMYQIHHFALRKALGVKLPLRLAVGLGRHPIPGLEAGPKIALRREAQIQRDLRNGMIRILQHLRRVPALFLLNILLNRNALLLGKEPGQVGAADPDGRRNVADLQVLAQILLNVILALVHIGKAASLLPGALHQLSKLDRRPVAQQQERLVPQYSPAEPLQKDVPQLIGRLHPDAPRHRRPGAQGDNRNNQNLCG